MEKKKIAIAVCIAIMAVAAIGAILWISQEPAHARCPEGFLCFNISQLPSNVSIKTATVTIFDKKWRYWTILNASCRQVECWCAINTSTPCMAYCMECEEANNETRTEAGD